MTACGRCLRALASFDSFPSKRARKTVCVFAAVLIQSGELSSAGQGSWPVWVSADRPKDGSCRRLRTSPIPRFPTTPFCDARQTVVSLRTFDRVVPTNYWSGIPCSTRWEAASPRWYSHLITARYTHSSSAPTEHRPLSALGYRRVYGRELRMILTRLRATAASQYRRMDALSMFLSHLRARRTTRHAINRTHRGG